MKKILILVSMVMAFFAMSCDQLKSQYSGSGLVGSSWTGTDQYNEEVTLTFTDASTGSGVIKSNGVQKGTIEFTYTMKDSNNGSGTAIVKFGNDPAESYKFTFVLINEKLYLDIEGMGGTMEMKRIGGSSGGGSSTDPAASLIGTSWFGTDPYGEQITITFLDATTGSGTIMDKGSLYGTMSFTYSMSNSTSGSGTAYVQMVDSGKPESYPFTFTLNQNVLTLVVEGMGTVQMTRTGGGSGGDTPGSSLIGTKWSYNPDNGDEVTVIHILTATSGYWEEWDDGEMDGQYDFTYSMTSNTQGSGHAYVGVFDGVEVVIDFTFVVSGNTMTVTATMTGESKPHTAVFTKQ